MRRNIVLILICIMVLCSCNKKDEGSERLMAFEGSWQCAESPSEHPAYYTGYLVWTINKDGSFSMYDAEAGNPGIAGNIQVVSEDEIRLHCNTEDDFDPPVTWESMKETQEVSYKFITENELQVSLMTEESNSTLVFIKTE